MRLKKYFTWEFIRGFPRGMMIKLCGRLFLHKSRKEQFTYVFQQGGFGKSSSLSGSGSDLEQTRAIRDEIPRLLREFGIKSMLDVPCGDWYWMRHVDLRGIRYIGGDIVPELIQRNIAEFGTTDERRFIVCDLCSDDLPKMDIVLCRDCLVHLKLRDAVAALRNIQRSGARYLLTTTHVSRTENPELKPIFFRPLNLQLPPFSLPPPVRLISEHCTEEDGAHSDKCLGLWKLTQITSI